MTEAAQTTGVRGLRRRLFHAMAFGAFGLAATTTAAWVLAFNDVSDRGVRAEQQGPYASSMLARTYPDGPGVISITRRQARGALVLESNAYGPDYQPPAGLRLITLAQTPEDVTPESITPGWAQRAALPWTVGGQGWPERARWESRHIDARGWPMLALRSTIEKGEGVPDRLRGGFQAPGGRMRFVGGLFGASEPVILPCRPIWGGLMVNALLFASMSAAACRFTVSAHRAFITIARVRRNCCAACGYDQRGLSVNTCPECGANRHPR